MAVRGWCPSLHEPMRSGDGWLARVKPGRATLTAGAARLVAALAAGHGNGRIELTNRGNLQLRGIAEAGLRPLADALVGAGLADPDPGRAQRVMAAMLSMRKLVIADLEAAADRS